MPIYEGIGTKDFGTFTGPRCLEIIGACPKCGSPIYGRKTLLEGEPAQVQRTCMCAQLQAGIGKTDIKDTMLTK